MATGSCAYTTALALADFRDARAGQCRDIAVDLADQRVQQNLRIGTVRCGQGEADVTQLVCRISSARVGGDAAGVQHSRADLPELEHRHRDRMTGEARSGWVERNAQKRAHALAR